MMLALKVQYIEWIWYWCKQNWCCRKSNDKDCQRIVYEIWYVFRWENGIWISRNIHSVNRIEKIVNKKKWDIEKWNSNLDQHDTFWVLCVCISNEYHWYVRLHKFVRKAYEIVATVKHHRRARAHALTHREGLRKREREK